MSPTLPARLRDFYFHCIEKFSNEKKLSFLVVNTLIHSHHIEIMKFSGTEFLLSPEAARFHALDYLAGLNPRVLSPEEQEVEFRAHYGTSSDVIANQWFDLCTTDIALARLAPREKSPQGFKRLMMAHFFLWQYPKNARTFASRFEVCERYGRGEPVWSWVDKIAALNEKMIVWKPDLDSTLTPVMVITIDGVDC